MSKDVWGSDFMVLSTMIDTHLWISISNSTVQYQHSNRKSSNSPSILNTIYCDIKDFTHVISFNPQPSYLVGDMASPILQMRKLRPREFRYLDQGHTQ